MRWVNTEPDSQPRRESNAQAIPSRFTFIQRLGL